MKQSIQNFSPAKPGSYVSEFKSFAQSQRASIACSPTPSLSFYTENQHLHHLRYHWKLPYTRFTTNIYLTPYWYQQALKTHVTWHTSEVPNKPTHDFIFAFLSQTTLPLSHWTLLHFSSFDLHAPPLLPVPAPFEQPSRSTSKTYLICTATFSKVSSIKRRWYRNIVVS